MLLMPEKDIRGGICHVDHWYAKADNKYIKGSDNVKNHDILKIGMWIIYIEG